MSAQCLAVQRLQKETGQSVHTDVRSGGVQIVQSRSRFQSRQGRFLGVRARCGTNKIRLSDHLASGWASAHRGVPSPNSDRCQIRSCVIFVSQQDLEVVCSEG